MPKSAEWHPPPTPCNMLVQEMIIENDPNSSQDIYERHFAPMSKSSRSDVPFPLVTPRRRAPSVMSMANLVEQTAQSVGVLTIRGTDAPVPPSDAAATTAELRGTAAPRTSLQHLPLEVQGKVLDFIFGDLHSVYAGSTSLRGKSVSSLMRHPRRKAVSDLALVSPAWRELVQERIYRHIKIKGTRAGLAESEEFFCRHMHLTNYIRHIEFWVPVWGDKASFDNRSFDTITPGPDRSGHYFLANQTNEGVISTNDLLGFGFKLYAYSATLSEIFSHINCFFPTARVFTLEGGHCKKSNMIRHFPKTLFPAPHQALDALPNVRTFAMRGAWNIMRNLADWHTIETALPNVEEWHCGYAKPRIEADATINDILHRLPARLRHVHISLDGMYSKDPTTLGSSSMPGQPHLCDRLGRVLPRLESLSFTGKICECLWTSALVALAKMKEESKLRALEIVVKSCCRQRVTQVDPVTGETIVHELGGVIADGAGITNLVFIRAFERLVMKTIEALPFFPHLTYIRIRFIDLDSPCTLLNPYWQLENRNVYGIWNEEIVERLSQVRPDTGYAELDDGIQSVGWSKSRATASNTHPEADAHHSTEISSTDATSTSGTGAGAGCNLYPKWKPRSIKTSSYKIVAEARGA